MLLQEMRAVLAQQINNNFIKAQIKEIINSAMLLLQAQHNIAIHSKNELERTVALAKVDAYQDIIKLMKNKLLGI